MGFSSQNGYIMLRSQSVAGTYQADTGTAGIAVKLRSGTLAPTRELLIPDPEIGGSRDMPDALLGTIAWAGDYEMYARFKELTIILKALLGAPTTATTTGVTTHTYNPVSTALPILSIEENIGGTFETFRYNDVKVNTFHMEAEANGYLMATVGMIAKNQIAGATATNPAGTLYDNSPLITGTNISITLNAVTLQAKSFTLDVNNNMEDDDFRLGSFFLGEITEKRRDVQASIVLRPVDSGIWRQAVYGTAASTAPTCMPTKQPVVITMTSCDIIPGGTPNTPYTLTVTLPNAVLKPHAVTPNGDDVIEETIEIQALRPSLAANAATFVLKNDVATVQ